MHRYRILSAKIGIRPHPTKHFHIIAVGAAVEPQLLAQPMPTSQVIQKMAEGDIFYTRGTRTGRIAGVIRYACEICREFRIRSAFDAVYDNQLESLNSYPK